jgi:hypothetical protein
LRGAMQSHGRRRRRVDAIKRGPRLIEEGLRFTMRDKLRIQVARAPRVDLFEDVQRGVMLVRFAAAQALDGQGQPLLGTIGNGKHAAREVKLLRPKMKQGLLAVSAHFPGHPRKRRNAPAVLVNFHNPAGSELLQTSLQFSGEFHGQIISQIRGGGTIFLGFP